MAETVFHARTGPDRFPRFPTGQAPAQSRRKGIDALTDAQSHSGVTDGNPEGFEEMETA